MSPRGALQLSTSLIVLLLKSARGAYNIPRPVASFAHSRYVVATATVEGRIRKLSVHKIEPIGLIWLQGLGTSRKLGLGRVFIQTTDTDMTKSFGAMSIAQLSVLIQNGAADPVEVTETVLEDIKVHPDQSIFTELLADRALEEAKASSARLKAGRSRGRPAIR